jgi:capsular exopolysaccharide synthesis family protein
MREAVDRLWGSVFFSPERTAPKSIVVASSEPGEGATQVAAALALTGSSSEHGMRIALVDFNVKHPMLAERFGVRPCPGTLDVLAGGASVEDAVVLVNRRLGVLPCGRPDASAMSLLRSERIGLLIRELTEQYDHVIIDAPPVNRHATVQAVAGLTDGVLLVTHAGATRRESVAEAKKRIELAQGRVIGVVLNQREFPIPAFLYGRL